MRSNELNFSVDHPIGNRIVPIDEFDGTVNLVITDGVNPLRLINSGFDNSGKLVPSRHYQSLTLMDEISLIKNTPTLQKITDQTITQGGKLSSGTYFFYWRYLDRLFNATNFVPAEHIVKITTKDSSNNSLNVMPYESQSQIQITFDINNPDTSFDFIQIAYIRFGAENNFVSVPEIFLIDKMYSINNNTKVNIQITGFEQHLPFNIGEIFRPVLRENICADITSANNILYGVNWSENELNIKALRDFAKTFRLGYCDDESICTIPMHEMQSFYSLSNDKAGYFRGESYCFGVIFVLKNGFETERFPIIGADFSSSIPRMSWRFNFNHIYQNYNPANPTANSLLNENGVIRMPSNSVTPYLRNNFDMVANESYNARILAVMVDSTLSFPFLNSNTAESNWIKENVVEYRIVRANRIPNLLYQGLLSRVVGRNLRFSQVTGAATYQHNSVSIPVMADGGSIPTITNRGGDRSRKFGSNILTNTWGQSDDEKKRRALFSSDLIFKFNDDILQGGSFYKGETQGRLMYTTTPKANHIGGVFKVARIDYTSRPINKNQVVHSISRGNNWVMPSNHINEFVNRANDHSDVIKKSEHITDTLFYFTLNNDDVALVNRSMITPPYLGIDFNNSNLSTEELAAIANQAVIYNIYNQSPSELNPVSLYSNHENMLYFDIGCKQPLRQSENELFVFRGDCFIQSTMIKTLSWMPTQEKGWIQGQGVTNIGADIASTGYGINSSSDANRYAHGNVFEFITENRVNTANRFNTDNQTDFIPANNDGDIWAFYPFSTQVKNMGELVGTGIDSHLVNPASSITLSLKSYASNMLHSIIESYKHNTRMRYSGSYDINRNISGYRNWMFEHKMDYDKKHGAIVRVYELFGRMVTIHERAILVHRINPESVVESTTGEFVIGTKSTLDAFPQTISEYGSSHIFGSIKSKFGIIGIDWNENQIWRVEFVTDARRTTGMNLRVNSLTDSTSTKSFFRKLKESYVDSNVQSQVRMILKDEIFKDNVLSEGIFCGYDPDFNEILINIRINGQNRIVVYNELINGFLEYRYPLLMQIHEGDRSYSIGKIFTGNQNTIGNKVYQNNKRNEAVFFNQPQKSILSFVVIGIEGRKNFSMIDKMFMSMEIESGITPQAIEKIVFETEYQQTENNPFHVSLNDMNSNFWLAPVYYASKWNFPINVTQTSNGQFNINSHMEGRWIKVTIHFKENMNFYIKNVVTSFITTNP